MCTARGCKISSDVGNKRRNKMSRGLSKQHTHLRTCSDMGRSYIFFSVFLGIDFDACLRLSLSLTHIVRIVRAQVKP